MTKRRHYHPVGIAIHWGMAALILFQLVWGWRTTVMAPGYDKLGAYQIHAFIGLAIFTLAFMRAGWRVFEALALPDMETPEDLPGWQKRAAEATHYALYVLMFALPLSGWVMLSASAGGGATLPWSLELPAPPGLQQLDFAARARLEQAAENTHLGLVFLMMALIAMHIAAAPKHHFIVKDDVLARMIPWLARRRRSDAPATPETRRHRQARQAPT